jgi:hypothetical protein
VLWKSRLCDSLNYGGDLCRYDQACCGHGCAKLSRRRLEGFVPKCRKHGALSRIANILKQSWRGTCVVTSLNEYHTLGVPRTLQYFRLLRFASSCSSCATFRVSVDIGNLTVSSVARSDAAVTAIETTFTKTNLSLQNGQSLQRCVGGQETYCRDRSRPLHKRTY